MRAVKKGFFNIAYSLLSQVILTVFAFVTPILVIENYGSAVNGLLHSTGQIFTILALLEAGVGSATIQALYYPVAKKDTHEISAIMAATRNYYTRTGIYYTSLIAAFACLYPVFVRTGLPFFFVVGIILCGGLSGSLNYFYYGKYALLMQTDGHAYVVTKIDILINILTNTAKIVLLLNGFNVFAVQLSGLVISVLRTFCYHLYVKKQYKYLDFSVKPNFQAISQKKDVLVHQFSYLVFSSTDVLLLTFLTQDLKLVSVYTLYQSIVSRLFTLVQQVCGSFDFRLGQMFANERERYNQYYHVFEIIHLVLIFTVMSALYVVLLPFMTRYTHNVTDANYINMWYPLLFVMVPLLTHGRTAASSTITFAGHFRQTKWYAVTETGINLVVSVIGILLLGLPGALLGTIAASLYRTFNIIFYCYAHFIPGSVWKTFKRWIVSFSLFICVILITYFFPLRTDNYVQMFFIAVGLGILFLFLYSLCQYIINKEERALLTSQVTQIFGQIKCKFSKREKANERKE